MSPGSTKPVSQALDSQPPGRFSVAVSNSTVQGTLDLGDVDAPGMGLPYTAARNDCVAKDESLSSRIMRLANESKSGQLTSLAKRSKPSRWIVGRRGRMRLSPKPSLHSDWTNLADL